MSFENVVGVRLTPPAQVRFLTLIRAPVGWTVKRYCGCVGQSRG